LAKRFYSHEGRFEPDDGIVRGRMLVRSEKEWRGRYIASEMKEIGWVMIIPFFIAITCIAIYLRYTEDGTVSIYHPLVLWGLLFPIMIVLLRMLRLKLSVSGPAVGLYEAGLQVTDGAFLPYPEIGNVTRRTVSEIGRKKDVANVWGRYERPDPPHYRPMWTMEMDILGEGGWKELGSRVAPE
jgi:hypothetical protein